MFTGIIGEVGFVTRLTPQGDQGTLHVRAQMFADADIVCGESVCVSGVCLTVLGIDDGAACFELGSETWRRTTLGSLASGSRVNLERSLKVGDRLSGHFVLGHVDAVAAVQARSEEGNTTRFEFSLPADVADLVVDKGAIAIDGVSLTTAEVEASSFAVYVIPYTRMNTLCNAYEPGTKVNVEADYLGRYVKGLAALERRADLSSRVSFMGGVK
jgi:riboflavin synthase